MVDLGVATLTLEMVAENQMGMKAIGAALAVGITGIGAGLAEMAIGSAAVGATAENKDIFGMALLLTVIPETIVIFGLVVSLLILF
jgi:V/A-type H+-transporting ATPase subunit K